MASGNTGENRDRSGFGHVAVNFSKPFVERPVATTLLAIGLLLAGLVGYRVLPVASLPSVEFPMIVVAANRPGADPAVMASTVAAPLERHLGEIAGVTDMRSSSGLGTTRIHLQFDLNRSLDGAARDVQAAINAAAADLPSALPTQPTYRKANPNASPALILALTSDSMPISRVYDAADTTLVQRIAQVPGVGEVNVSGAEQPAIRIRANPMQLAAMGVSMDDVRSAAAAATQLVPLGTVDGRDELISIETNAQLRSVTEYESIIIKSTGGVPIRLQSHQRRPWPVRLMNALAFLVLRIGLALSGVAGRY